jgi:hypothetical protein
VFGYHFIKSDKQPVQIIRQQINPSVNIAQAWLETTAISFFLMKAPIDQKTSLQIRTYDYLSLHGNSNMHELGL